MHDYIETTKAQGISPQYIVVGLPPVRDIDIVVYPMQHSAESFPDCLSGLGMRLGTRLYIAHGLRTGNETSHTIPTPALWTNLVVSSPRPKLVS